MKAGILIGKAGKIQSNSSGIFKNIAVEPIVDLSTLEIVFIEKK
jgi:cell shape-determining protein MreC